MFSILILCLVFKIIFHISSLNNKTVAAQSFTVCNGTTPEIYGLIEIDWPDYCALTAPVKKPTAIDYIIFSKENPPLSFDGFFCQQ